MLDFASMRTLGWLWVSWLLLAAREQALPAAGLDGCDLVIRHGRVVDGTGAPAFHADVAIKNGRFVAVGNLGGLQAPEVDASGLVVAPGFIDVHTHVEDILEQPEAEHFLRMGITTLITGNCGSSAPDIAAFFQAVEAKKIAPNLASLIGHGGVREKAMGGSFNRPPTAAELSLMKHAVAQGMKDGALGLSTGLIYLPGTFAKTAELVELARVVKASDGIYASHLRDEGPEIRPALAEVFQVARETGIRAEISHLKLRGQSAWGQAAEILQALDTARAEGLDITQDQYVYTAASTSIESLIMDEARTGGPEPFKAWLSRPADKARVVADMKQRLQRSGREDYRYAVIADFPADRSLNGLNLAEAALKLRNSSCLDAQIDCIFDIYLRGGATGVFHGLHEADVRAFLAHPNTMAGSDSGLHRFQVGVPHPRGYGNHARVLGHYVRELKLLRLEEAVRKMTSLPAGVFRLAGRGQIREGFLADAVVFDPATIQDRATFEQPHQYATGIAQVLVNGVLVIKNGQPTGARPGQVLRGNSQ